MPVRVRAFLCAISLASGSLLACGTPGDQPESPDDGATSCPTCAVWKPLRIGAGGWVTGLDIALDGEKVVRTDTYGAYRWNSSLGEWVQLVTGTSVGEGSYTDPEPLRSGVYEIRIAPSNTQRYYMVWDGYIYRTDNRGASWTKTSFPRNTELIQTDNKMFGPKMAVDPADDDTVYFGTMTAGVWCTHDGGASWTQIPTGTIPFGTGDPGHAGIAFDPTSRVNGSGYTNVIYVPSYGHGVWRTANGGSSWSQMSGAPTRVKNGKVGNTSGAYFCSSGPVGSGTLHKYTGSWTDISPSASREMIAIDRADNSKIIAMDEGGHIQVSTNSGATWGSVIHDHPREATDIPWLAWTNEDYMSAGAIEINPVDGRLYFAEGIGVWTATAPVPGEGSITWTSKSKGIEQLVANDITAPPGGKPVVASWDRPLFYVANPDVFPSQHGVDNTKAIVMGWSVDYASTNPSFLVALANWWGVEQDGYSTDGGQTWTVFPTFPGWDSSNWPIGGSIAASSPDNIVWVPANGKAPYHTKDRGQTWQKVVLPAVPDPAGWGGTHRAYYLNRHIVVADRVNPDSFYFYNYPYGLFSTTNKGDTWTQVFSGEIAPYSGYNAKLKSVPGKAGHLFFTSGQLDGGLIGPFMHSTNGGVSWSAVPNVLEVYAFGFGKEAPGGSYPAIYIVGWVNNVYGLWRSDDEGQSWTQVGDYPLGSLDQIRTVDGDKNTYGTFYIGFAGSGYAYRRPN